MGLKRAGSDNWPLCKLLWIILILKFAIIIDFFLSKIVVVARVEPT